MGITPSIKKNKFFSFLSLCFLVWIAFLIIAGIVYSHEVVFFDALSNMDVSSRYQVQMSLLRYLVEPIAGISFIIDDDFDWVFGYIFFYIIARIVYLVIYKFNVIKSEKYRLISCLFDDIIRFSFVVFSLMVLIIAIIILIGNLTIGFLFVSAYWMIIIQTGMTICYILIFIKIVFMAVKLFHPYLRFNYEKRKKNRRRLITKSSNISKSIRFTTREFCYLFGIMLSLIGVQIGLISTQFPTYKIVTDLEYDEFLFDFHVHTTFSDGWLTPQERVFWYIEHGISGAAFSDHDNIRGALAARNIVEQNNLDFIVIIAQEWTDHEADIHMNIYGVEETIVPLESEWVYGPLALNASDMIKHVKKKGGYVTVNHYNNRENINGGLGVPYTYEQLRDWGVDGFEIVNGDHIQEQEILQFCLDNNLICIGGSDIHYNEPLNHIVKIRLEDPSNLTVGNIFKNLKRNEHEVIAISLYPNRITLPEFFDDLGLHMLDNFINYVLNLDTFQIISWIIWSSGFYFVIFYGRKRIKKMRLQDLSAKLL